jgi:hypothetical protein
VLVLLAGCDRVFLGDRPSAAIDAPLIDVPDELPLCQGKYGRDSAGLVRLCLPEQPPATWLEASPINTGTQNPSCTFVINQAGKDLCVIAARNITITATIRAIGGRPLVLIAQDTLRVEPGATVNLVGGAGSDEKACPGNIGGATNMGGGGGGAGGGYATRGASGGNGGVGAGGTSAGPEAVPTTLRGGCNGGTGGEGAASQTGGNAGISGGAVYLIAGTLLEVQGTINASGEGGHGGGPLAGGGGGGSGGYIGLDAPTIQLVNARLVANGGGGGAGGGSASTGNPGQTADPAGVVPYPSPGGTGTGGGGDGGRGGNRNQVSQGGNNSASGGGGGGGGTGHIRLYAEAIQNTGSEITPVAVEN